MPSDLNVGELQWAEGSDHLVYAAGGASLAISKDAGATFTDVLPGGCGSAAKVNHVAVWQNEPADAFPAVIYALGDSTMFLSVDGGVSWTRDMGQLPPRIGGVTNQSANFNAAHVMAISPRCPLHVFVTENGSGSQATLYRGDYTRFFGTQASSWSTLPLPEFVVDADNQDSGNVFLLATQRGRGDLLFYGPQRFSFPNDITQSSAWVGPVDPQSGSDWTRLGSGHPDLHGFLLSPDFAAEIDRGQYKPGTGTLWMLSDGGIYRSADGGQNFSPARTAATLSALSVAGVSIAG